MKRMLMILMALMLLAVPSLAQQAQPDMLSSQELNAFTERLLVRGMADNLTVEPTEESGNAARGEGYTLYLDSKDLSLDAVLSDASIDLSAVELEDLQDMRSITVLTPLQMLYEAYPDENPQAYGTRDAAVLYLKGSPPGTVNFGLVTRDGQTVRMVEHAIYEPSEDGYMHSGIQYTIDQGFVVGIHYFGGSYIVSANDVEDRIAQLKDLQRQNSYFAYDTKNPLPFESEDLNFGDLNFFDLTPERAVQILGKAAHDERVKESDTQELRIMQWDGIEIAFSYGEKGELTRTERLFVSLPGMEGPRGLRVGTELMSAIERFPHEAEFTSSSQTLYGEGDIQQAPYGRLETQGNEAQLYYAADQNGETVLLSFEFSDGELYNMGATYY